MVKAFLKKCIAAGLVLLLLAAMAPSAVAAAAPSEEAFGALVHTLQEEFPAGKYWNDANGIIKSGRYRGGSMVGDRPCTGYGCGSLAVDGVEWAWQCHGYAMLMADHVFGSFYNIDHSNWIKTDYTRGRFSGELYAGDVVRTVLPSGRAHSVFVYKVTEETVYYTECNRHNKCKLGWETQSVQDFKKRVTFIHHFKGNTLKGDKTVTPQLTIAYNTNGGVISAGGNYYADKNGQIFSGESKAVYEQQCYMGITYPDGPIDAATFKLERKGYQFMGWSVKPQGATLWFENQVFLPEQLCENLASGDQSLTFYAVWKDLRSELPFYDVWTDHWYYEGVKYTNQKGWMNGTSSIEFAPESPTTRAMLVTVLHRIEGSPAPQKESDFSDVAAGLWYTQAVAWAAENDIVNGMGDGTFAPDDKITREQLTTVLFRYAQYKQKSEQADPSSTVFADQEKVSEWAKEGMQWAVCKGIINGITAENKLYLQPQGSATRAQIATVLMRYSQEILK